MLPKIALASVHSFEEPCISGTKGSGTVFFSGCNLQCLYCQNEKISRGGVGKEITIEELAEVFLKEQSKGVHNLNLVTPTIYVPQIIEALKKAKEKGFYLPVIYNSSGYEKKETIDLLKGWIDIYLPDFKYQEEDLAKKYSHVNQYAKYAKESILQMIDQVGEPQWKNGILQKGVLVRHLVLPNHTNNSIKVLDWMKEVGEGKMLVSIMAQYFPTAEAMKTTDLNRKLTKREYKKIQDHIYELDLKNGYLQELGDHEEEFVPKFDLSM